MAANDNGTPGRGSPRRFIQGAAAAVNVVGTLVGAVLGGFFGGYFLDRWLHTSPAFTLVGSFLGTAAGAYMVYRETRRFAK